MSDRATTEYPPICIVSPSEFDPGTAMNSAAITKATCAASMGYSVQPQILKTQDRHIKSKRTT
jgi:hypothetical protein